MDDFESVLRKGFTGAGKGTVLLIAGLAAGVVYAAGLVNSADVNGDDPLVVAAWALATFLPLFVIPYLLGGAIGYVLERSSGGSPGWPAFFASARRHYSGLFMSGVAVLIITTLLVYFAEIMFLTGEIVLLCVGGLVGIAALFLVMMYLEFYDVSTVAEGLDGMQGLKASYVFVRSRVRLVVPYFIIVLIAKFLVSVPLMAAGGVRMAADILNNSSIYFNANGTLNESYFNSTMTLQTQPFSAPSLLAIAVLQILVQTVVFAFVISYKTEFYQWAKTFKTPKKITDFDYDFSAEEKKE